MSRYLPRRHDEHDGRRSSLVADARTIPFRESNPFDEKEGDLNERNTVVSVVSSWLFLATTVHNQHEE